MDKDTLKQKAFGEKVLSVANEIVNRTCKISGTVIYQNGHLYVKGN